MNCRICHTVMTGHFEVREMIFGIQGSFTYYTCGECGCVQLADVPADLARFYPADYYSLKGPANLEPFSPLKRFLLRQRDLHYFGVKKSVIGSFANKIFPAQTSSQFIPYHFCWEVLNQSADASIHDVGCGTGVLLRYFASFGYSHLSGSDPFISADIKSNGLSIYKKEWAAIHEKFDAIMMNHVLEHSLDPRLFLLTAHKNLKDKGKLLVRVPMADSAGFQKYHANWVGMEAPRHVHLFTQKSFLKLAHACGFTIEKVEFDAVSWHYMVSEGYKKGIYLKDQKHETMYTPGQHKMYEDLATEDNRQRHGDTCAFYLIKN